MPRNFTTIIELLKHAQSEQLYDALLFQLQKDFKLASIAFHIPSTLSGKELKKLLHEKIYYLLLEKFDMYLNLLYIIDVPEKEFKHINMTDVVEVADQMTFLILQRELQKVWFKKKFST